MNIINLAASAAFVEVANKQGWNLKSIADVMSDFLTSKQLWPEVLEYAKQRAAEENTEER